MRQRARYLIVDGHSIVFAWSDLRKLHERRPSLARDALIKQLRGPTVTAQSDPVDVQIFYSRRGQTADTIIERLASKYAARFDLIVATSDFMEQQTASACGAECMSPETLRKFIQEGRPRVWRSSRGK
ncbi:MAG: hypothetical protein DMF30_05925 [Verrucomicrobia bacterium]|nr:MAG: hypothetical protein DMF30_05925 [Verrucomicrobiota bacterium]